MGHLVVKSI